MDPVPESGRHCTVSAFVGSFAKLAHAAIEQTLVS
jgi:hypothetical protein